MHFDYEREINPLETPAKKKNLEINGMFDM